MRVQSLFKSGEKPAARSRPGFDRRLKQLDVKSSHAGIYFTLLRTFFTWSRTNFHHESPTFEDLTNGRLFLLKTLFNSFIFYLVTHVTTLVAFTFSSNGPECWWLSQNRSLKCVISELFSSDLVFIPSESRRHSAWPCSRFIFHRDTWRLSLTLIHQNNTNSRISPKLIHFISAWLHVTFPWRQISNEYIQIHFILL